MAAELRQNAFARFCEVGFPTTHDEDWRFTNVAADRADSLPAGARKCDRLSATELEPYRVEGVAGQLVFVNGRFAPELSAGHRCPRA